ncbi:metalloprotease, partial [Streptomyces sp. MBT57]|nr:metalloprotease [Streptomyces sp. MBT57]
MLDSIWLKAAGIAAAVTLTTVTAANATPAPTPRAAESTAAVVTIRYDDSRAGGWEAAIAAGVASWNSTVDNVKLVEAAPGTRAEIQIVATSGWPQATLGPVRPGAASTSLTLST